MHWLFKGIGYKCDQPGRTWSKNSLSLKFSNETSIGDNDKRAGEERSS